MNEVFDDSAGERRNKLIEVAAVFTRLGFTAFGGPAVHIGMMEDEIVTRRRWIDRQHFLDLISAVNFIPGPNSTELAIALGAVRAGFAGLVVAGVCFITPAVLIILPLAWAYVRFGSMPRMQPVMHGLAAAVLAVVMVALVRFAKTGIRSGFTVGAGIGALLMELAMLRWLPGVTPEVPVLASAALAGLAKQAIVTKRARRIELLTLLPIVHAPDFWRMVGAFLKIGGTLFGSGYVLLSYLQSNFVDAHGWLTRQQVIDAIAVGQFTPGPVLTTATFIGYLLGSTTFHGGVMGGVVGGVAATIAIFLPSFCFTALLNRAIDRLRRSPAARGALDAMNAAVVALIAVVVARMAGAVLNDAWNVSTTVVCIAALTIWRINATWLILGAAAIRYIFPA